MLPFFTGIVVAAPIRYLVVLPLVPVVPVVVMMLMVLGVPSMFAVAVAVAEPGPVA